MRHTKRGGRERAFRWTASQAASNPVGAGMSASVLRARLGDDIFVELKCVACGRPVLERAGLEIEIERAPVRLWQHTLRLHARDIRNVEASFHAGGPVPGNRAVVGVAGLRFEREARRSAFIENLRAP